MVATNGMVEVEFRLRKSWRDQALVKGLAAAVGGSCARKGYWASGERRIRASLPAEAVHGVRQVCSDAEDVTLLEKTVRVVCIVRADTVETIRSMMAYFAGQEPLEEAGEYDGMPCYRLEVTMPLANVTLFALSAHNTAVVKQLCAA